MSTSSRHFALGNVQNQNNRNPSRRRAMKSEAEREREKESEQKRGGIARANTDKHFGLGHQMTQA